ncbi:MAG: P-II family nitrogen regulator [Coriobacteriia bacterium]|nr:P-II family nitrogen regulator [Coriobacteriia bacterium]MBN2822158.1 P-II family nitrogen regulator [Coriobacteriia bacterium]
MKRIEAIIRPERVDEVLRALKQAGCSGVTLYSASGHGVQRGVHQQWRGQEYVVDLLPKTVVITIVPESDVREVTETIEAVARTGRMGDGKVFVTPIERAVRVRTGESGEAALRPSAMPSTTS